jgi:hypothetical protein
MSSIERKVNVLMVGTGEYTTGYVDGMASSSDKGAGVVALAMFDLRRRDKVDRIGMCGVNVSPSPRNSVEGGEWGGDRPLVFFSFPSFFPLPSLPPSIHPSVAAPHFVILL